MFSGVAKTYSLTILRKVFLNVFNLYTLVHGNKVKLKRPNLALLWCKCKFEIFELGLIAVQIEIRIFEVGLIAVQTNYQNF